jgi:radical SAM protein with 4Fe4S-binding SPASM domain
MKHFYSAFKKHILVNILEWNFFKPLHFLIAIMKRKLFGYPYVALVEIGNYCNLSCPTCPTPASKICRKKELMTLENFKKVVDNLKDSVHVLLLYFTNEPLLNSDLAAMLKYAHKSNLYTEISSNAVLLNETKTAELLESGPDKIILDLDGASKESYEHFRAGADFDKVLGNIRYFCRQKKLLKLRKPFIELQFVLNKFNQDEVGDIKTLARELGVDNLSIRSFGLGRYAYNPEEIKELSTRFLPDSEKYQKKIRYKKEGQTLEIKNSPKKCPLARTHLVVLVDGTVVMCCYDLAGQYVYGNIFYKKLKDIWFSHDVRKKRQAAQSRQHALCKTCSIYD